MTRSNLRLKLPLVPASFFGIVLGLAGLANDWRAAHLAWGLPSAVADVIYGAALLIWALLLALYSLKWIGARKSALEEAMHPVQCCFVGLVGVATLLVAQGAPMGWRPLALALFALGAVFTFGFGIWRTGQLWQGDRDPATTTPVLYLPLVAGGFVTATVVSGFGYPKWGELAFGAAFFTWLAIESVLLHRLYTAPALAPALRPTLGIQLAPPAVGATAYLAVAGGEGGMLAHMMIGYALLQVLILARAIRWIAAQPFGPGYWAFTFGGTALAGATIRLSMAPGETALAALAPYLFVAANLLVLGIFFLTLGLLIHGRLLPAPVPER
ncbi:dicarboxylate transporter/tellurite-resistance protein TehA [Sphingomonas kyeonggiensis]|uniref:Tellurite resistance protein n=1 Tax=Sphingomonas kyeonggiensis TaxID=1268553 RepID=A0A7W6JR19_9SPHN|nr:dicarboxylate transporter/tellurite-resistance protein TehA [Sphingomonas kyeonggiensis]MBB4097976.1 tellurite resistance protein [Sphingomonas kyeonggiensis]